MSPKSEELNEQTVRTSTNWRNSEIFSFDKEEKRRFVCLELTKPKKTLVVIGKPKQSNICYDENIRLSLVLELPNKARQERKVVCRSASFYFDRILSKKIVMMT